MLILISYVSSGMSFSSGSDDQVVGRVCLMSPVEARVTFDGNPVKGAVVTRTVDWKGRDKKMDSVVTNADGFFRLGILESHKKKNWLSEFVAIQEIVVEYQGYSYRIWEMSNRDPVENAELGRPIVLECELLGEEYYPETPKGLLITMCKLI
jgi:hypothetical protein